MRFEFRFLREAPDAGSARRSAAPLRILVMADFAGRGARGEAGVAGALSTRKLLAVDQDTLGTAFERCAPRLRIRPGEGTGPELEIEFGSLADFHPDALFERLGLFAALRDARERLRNPATFPAAAAELGGSAAAPGTPTTGAVGNGQGESEADAETLRRLLGSVPGDIDRVRSEGRLREDVRRMVRELVAPYVVAEADPRQEELIASLDRAVGGQMRAVLHHPAFQALEAAWRSVERLVGEIEFGEQVRLFLLDASRAEIETDLSDAGADLEQSRLHRLIVDDAPGPWSLIVADCAFGPSSADVALLAALGALASRAGGAFLAAASPALLGCRSLALTPDAGDWTGMDGPAGERWAALRASPWARWIGLALPRVLMRLPYGAKTEATERFAFEELEPGREHESYLWGNPAFTCAELLAESFLTSGWAMEPDQHRVRADLPAHAWREGAESKLEPCAEVVLNARSTGAILRLGLMPLVSFADRNAVELARFQSLADPPAALAGPWS
jgi:type VI secretion system protein ImpC